MGLACKLMLLSRVQFTLSCLPPSPWDPPCSWENSADPLQTKTAATSCASTVTSTTSFLWHHLSLGDFLPPLTMLGPLPPS